MRSVYSDPAFHILGFVFRRSGYSVPAFCDPAFHVLGFSATRGTWVIHTVEEAPNVPVFFLGILNKWRTIGFCNLNIYEGEGMAFI